MKHLLQKRVKGSPPKADPPLAERFKVQGQTLNPKSIGNLIKHNLRISKKQVKSSEKIHSRWNGLSR
jgi:hypothetical protein